jgi:asparagine synthase (glutamine-hydrolysing)
MADPILGGITVGRSFDRASRTASAEHSIRRLNGWGVPLGVLPRLLRKEVFGDSVERIVSEMREDYAAAAGTDLARSWLFHAALRGRFVQGRMWGRMAFSGWPRAPHIDRALLRVVAGVPLPVLADRRLELEMLERFHTPLARLPLDRNDHDITPPLPGVMDLVRAGLDRRIRRLRKRIGLPRPDRRYYHRTYDFDGGGWRAIRRGAERDRERAYAWFDRATYDSLVPPAEAPWRSTGTIEGPSAAKLLTGVAVWQRIAPG